MSSAQTPSATNPANQAKQPPLASNYFELLGQELEYQLDQEALRQAYINLMKDYHPDALACLDTSKKLAATQQSYSINQAYAALSDDLKRAQALLNIRTGKEIEYETSRVNDAEFLLAQFEIRGQVDKLKREFDFGLFSDLNDKAESLRAETVSALAEAFASEPAPALLSASVQAQVLKLIHRLQFITKLSTELAELEG